MIVAVIIIPTVKVSTVIKETVQIAYTRLVCSYHNIPLSSIVIWNQLTEDWQIQTSQKNSKLYFTVCIYCIAWYQKSCIYTDAIHHMHIVLLLCPSQMWCYHWVPVVGSLRISVDVIHIPFVSKHQIVPNGCHWLFSYILTNPIW